MNESAIDPLVPRLERLYSAVVADVLDTLGARDQCLSTEVKPLDPGFRCAGVVRTASCVPATRIDPPEPYKLEMEAIDSLKPGEVLVFSRGEWAIWGELLSTAAKWRGAHGVIVDGYSRDTKGILDLGFPVFCRGVHPADSMGRLDVDAYDVPITCAGVDVAPGDLVLADRDGVVIVPRRLADTAVAKAEEKVQGEDTVRDKLAEGMSLSEAFRRYGIL